MSLSINILIPVALPDWWEDMAIRRYRLFASPGTEVIGQALSEAQQKASNCGKLLEQLIENARDAERRAACVHILDCFGDPYLSELQNQLDAPVVGVGQSTLLASSSWFERFGVVTSEKDTEAAIQGNAIRCGVGLRLVGSKSIDMSAADVPGHYIEAFARLREQAIELSKAGAEAVLLGCTELALMAESLQGHLAALGLEMRVVNPIAVSQRWAEMTAVGCRPGLVIA